MSVLCLGEAIVDLVCERPVDDVAQADGFRPHLGGVVANVAVAAASVGAQVRLAGGVGGDPWGRWLRQRLGAAGVGLDCFGLVAGCATPIAFVTAGVDGEPAFLLYGDGIAATVRAVGDRLPAAMEESSALFFSSNTLVGKPERELTMAARERALELERPVLFDPNLRLHRWPTTAAAAAAANACVPGALLVRCNRREAQVLTGENDPERAATALVKTGARMALISLGPEGAMLRGAVRADEPGRPAQVVSTVGAGDVLTGILLGRLALAGFYPPALAAALPEAVEASARATERWSALT